ncbi:MAG: Fe-S cluster assembly protein SufB [Deltaproteobacteria bacterium]|nr:Fe-S cluster assembly protein SufB [Deltaproteobacteria bacterium]
MDSHADLNKLNDDYAERYGFSDVETSVVKAPKGLSHEVVDLISDTKDEPEWMRRFRHEALDIFLSKPMPKWGNQKLLGEIDFDEIYYYLKPAAEQSRSWDDVPEDIRNTFERLGVPEAERKFLAGVSAQYDSEVVYHSMKEELEKQGVIFLDMDTAVREQPDLVRRYFATIIGPADNKFASLNSAVWSGGSFIYVPPGTHVDIPLQAYFRINAERLGQFERTLIIADEGSSVHYIEGCTAPIYATDSLHAAVVELVALEGSRIRYTTIQNWSNSVFNLVTKRAQAHAKAVIEWVDGNIGSKLTMKYPCVYLLGEGAHGEVLSIALAGDGQHQDTGAKMFHMAPNTTSRIISKSISKGAGRASYRGWAKIVKQATGCKTQVQCDALLLDGASRSDTYPTMEVAADDAQVEHEARVSKLADEQLFYLQSRGIDLEQARLMVVNGFIEPFVRELPMEYAVELNRLIQLEMEGSVG